MKRTDFTGFPTLVGDSGHDRSDIPMTSVMADLHKSACEKGMSVKVCPPSKACVPEKDCPKTDFKLSPSADCSGAYVRKNFILKSKSFQNGYFSKLLL